MKCQHKAGSRWRIRWLSASPHGLSDQEEERVSHGGTEITEESIAAPSVYPVPP